MRSLFLAAWLTSLAVHVQGRCNYGGMAAYQEFEAGASISHLCSWPSTYGSWIGPQYSVIGRRLSSCYLRLLGCSRGNVIHNSGIWRKMYSPFPRFLSRNNFKVAFASDSLSPPTLSLHFAPCQTYTQARPRQTQKLPLPSTKTSSSW